MTEKEAENLALLLHGIIEIPDGGVYAEECANNAISTVDAIRKEFPKIDKHIKEIEEIYSP